MDMNHAREEMRHDPMLPQFSNLAKEKNVPLFLVGGYLRDLLLGIRAKDYDFALPRKASYFIEVMRMVVLKGSGLRDIAPALLKMCGFAVLLNAWAVMSYRKRS